MTPVRPTGQSAVAGALAVGLALGVGELLGRAPGLPSPVELVGGVVVRASPPWLVDLAIGAFGTANVVVLQVGVALVAIGAGAGAGRLARRWPLAAWAVFAAAGLAGTLAALGRPEHTLAAAAVPSLAAVLTGVVVLGWLLGLEGSVDAGAGQDPARRAFLRACATVGVLGVVVGTLGRALPSTSLAREAARVPRPPDPLPPPPASASLEVDGITPLMTPNDDFYVIDTALRPPSVDPESWELRVAGLVERPFALDYEALLELATDEADILLACVSNEVGGDLAGTARWQGVWLDALLDRAGVRPEGTQVVGRAVDGFTVAFPTSAAFDGRQALVAVAMNGEPLPRRHGFPARLVVAGLYGYVSATKWLAEIELATDEFEGYWVPRGWARQAPIKMASRIDVPRQGETLAPGRVAVAGVAWAPLAGVAAVEVRVDEGPWVETRLAEELSGVTWRQWVHEWPAEPGQHMLAVRAIDRDGVTQTAARSSPRPDGATGWHSITVQVG